MSEINTEKKCKCKTKKTACINKKYVNKSYLLPDQIDPEKELIYKTVIHKPKNSNNTYKYYKHRDKPITNSFIRFRIHKFTKTEDMDLLLKIHNNIKLIVEEYKKDNINKDINENINKDINKDINFLTTNVISQ